jgi:hypothetical protein
MSSISLDLIRRIRDQLRARSAAGMSEFVAAFRASDKEGLGSLDSRQFDSALRQCGLFVGMYDVSSMMRAYGGMWFASDSNSNILSHFRGDFPGSDGRLQISAFVSAVVGELSPARQQLVRGVFSALDQSGRGSIPFSKLRVQFNAARHPDVERGVKQAGEINAEFLQTMRVATGASDTASITLRDFERYYEFVSAAFASDDQFARLVQRVWTIDASAAGGVPTGTASMSAGSVAPTSALGTVLAVLRDKLMQRSSATESLSSVMTRAFRFVRSLFQAPSWLMLSCCNPG